MLKVDIPKTNKGQEVVKPHPGGQTQFLQASAFEALFGGAAGPGKTFSLVLDALGLQFKNTALGKFAIEDEKYRAVLFRRQTTQLADLIDECKNYYYEFNAEYVSMRKGDPGVSFNFPKYYQKNGKAYKTYTEGARIFLCHLNEENDKENHQGFEYQYIGFDELAQFTFTQYIYLFSRCRSTVPDLFPRMRATSNPVGIGLGWVKKRFHPHLETNKKRYFLADQQDEKNYRGVEVDAKTKYALSRMYIPGRLPENLTLMARDPNYASRIKAMGVKLSKALLDSDWEVMEGQFFDMWNTEVHVIKEKDYWTYQQISSFDVLGVIDYGSTMVFSLMLKDKEGNIILFDQMTSIREVRQERVERLKKYLLARNLAKIENGKFICKLKMVLGDTDMWLKSSFDLAMQEEPARAFIDAGIPLMIVSKHSSEDKTYRIACNIAVKNALFYLTDNEGKIIKQPTLKVYERCKEFRETFPELPIDEDNPEDIADVDTDHWYDSFKMGFMVLRETKTKEPDNRPNWLIEMQKHQQNKTQTFMELKYVHAKTDLEFQG